MYSKVKNRFWILISYMIAISFNALANILPFNGNLSKDISDKYMSLFTPAPYTFSIWGIIYLFLAIYVYRMLFIKYDKKDLMDYEKIGNYFILSNIINCIWVLCWHYDLIILTVIFIIILLFVIYKLYRLLNLKNDIFSLAGFSMYFSWLTVATIANIVTLLVKYNINSYFGFREELVTVFVLIVALLVFISTGFKYSDPIYFGVAIWSFIGILSAHIDTWNNNFPVVINIIYLSTFILVIALVINIKSFIVKKVKK